MEAFLKYEIQKDIIKEEIKSLEIKNLREGRIDSIDKKEKELLLEYYNMIIQEEIHWKQKAIVTWLQSGNRNTRLFKMSALRRTINKIVELKCTNEILNYDEE